MALNQFGTLSTLDTLKSNFQNVIEYGEDKVFDDFENLRMAHNRIWESIAGGFVEFTTDRFRRYGGSTFLGMEELDEFGTPHPQKVRMGSNVGFPLKLWGGALQWTRKYFQNATVSEFALDVEAMFNASVNNLVANVKTALFTPTNYDSDDRLVDNLGNGVTIPVKALVNADSQEIPAGPNGESFNAATHTHYLYSAALDVAAMDALIKTVVEHFSSGTVMIYINQAQEATFAGLTGFKPYLDVRVTPGISSDRALDTRLDMVNIYNRAIGLYGAAQVWVKPWVPANYQFCFMEGQPRPLALRSRKPGSYGLELVSESESHPLYARKYEQEFGVGVWNRVNGAINFSNSGSAYSTPSFSSALS